MPVIDKIQGISIIIHTGREHPPPIFISAMESMRQQLI